jgi:hypothetical protein
VRRLACIALASACGGSGPQPDAPPSAAAPPPQLAPAAPSAPTPPTPAPAPPPLPPPAPIAIVAASPCPQALNASIAGIDLRARNLTTVTHDVCKTADHALAVGIPSLSALTGADFRIDVTLEALRVDPISTLHAYVSCKVAVRLDTPKEALGFARGAAKLQTPRTARHLALATTDCIEAVVEHVLARKAGPLLQQHVAGTAPVPMPTPRQTPWPLPPGGTPQAPTGPAPPPAAPPTTP